MTRRERIWLREWVERKRGAALDARKAADQIEHDNHQAETHEGAEWLRGVGDEAEEAAKEIAAFIGWD